MECRIRVKNGNVTTHWINWRVVEQHWWFFSSSCNYSMWFFLPLFTSGGLMCSSSKCSRFCSPSCSLCSCTELEQSASVCCCVRVSSRRGSALSREELCLLLSALCACALLWCLFLRGSVSNASVQLFITSCPLYCCNITVFLLLNTFLIKCL